MSQKDQAAFDAKYDEIHKLVLDMEAFVRARHDRSARWSHPASPVNWLIHDVINLHQRLLELDKLDGQR